MPTAAERNTVWGFLVLRAFLAQFWFLQMIGKARDQESGITSFHNLTIWSQHTTDWMVKTTPLPEWAVMPFTTVLPYCELLFGLLFLVGFQVRRALIASALLLVALDVGLMFQLKHDVVGNNTIFMIVTLMALQWESGNRWSIDALLRRKKAAT